MSQIGGVPFRHSSGYLGTFCPIWLRATETPARRWVVSLALLLLGYFVAGIFGRFPWKADEPHSFGMIWEILEENQWLVMQIADQPFVEKPPLVYWLGALCAKAFPFLAIHESARLAVPILVTISLFPLYTSARRLWPETVRWRAWVQVAGHDASDQQEDTVTHASVYALLALALVAGTLGFSEQIHSSRQIWGNSRVSS
jgi:4-amino-4-deoxy-L-arabinose transferase-like glycosyltransferase